jgi:NAD(P)-dependent dehydrogenase (short-subunit alcohol dehydrogenase family)
MSGPVSAEQGATLLVGGSSALDERISEQLAAGAARVRRFSLGASQGDTGAALQEGIRADVASVVADVGAIDALVLKTPQLPDLPASGITPDALDHVLRESVVAGFFWCQAVAASMRERGRGVIVIVGSVDAFQAEAGGALRSLVHGGLLGLVRSLGVEWAPLGVRVVGVAHSAEARADDDAMRRTPIGRLPSDVEVAATVDFLCSDEASYVAGETIRVDGGLVAYQMF